MPADYRARRDRLRELLLAADVPALLVTDLVNIRYLTGFTGSNAALIVGTYGTDSAGGDESATVICTDGRYTEQVANQVPDLEAVIERASAAALIERAGSKSLGQLGFEATAVTVAQFDCWRAIEGAPELTAQSGFVEELRRVKDPYEVDMLRAACRAADTALAELISKGGLRPDRTEREVARELEFLMYAHGADKIAFETIVATGANSAIPHHRPTGAVLAAGDFVKLDFGAVVSGYHSDMTRTFVLGRAADWQVETYELVAEAQAAGRAALAVGAKTKDVDAAARAVIAAAGHEELFSHGLGHGVGLQIHEAPGIGKLSDDTLKSGDAVTVEPGVYFSGRGGVRIEDTLVVRDGEPELLTLTSKDFTVV